MNDQAPPAAGDKWRFVKWVLSGALVVLAATLATRLDTFLALFPVSLTLAGALVVLLVLRRSWTDLLLALSGAAVLWLIDFQLLPPFYWLVGAVVLLGICSFTILGLHAVWAHQKDRGALVCAFVVAVLMVGSQFVGLGLLLDITEKLHPKVFDLYLYSFDSSLRVQIDFELGKLLATHSWLAWTCHTFYNSLALVLALVFAAQLRPSMFGQSLRRALPVGIAFLIAGPLGVLLYNLLPACGPVYLFGSEFPFHAPPIAEVMHHKLETIRIPHYLRNAIPSLHMAWVLLAWWSSRKLALWIRAIAFAFLAFTAIATVGLGEHYFVDVVVAYPFALMVLAICSYTIPFSNHRRRGALLWGVFATLLWFALLSFATELFWITPVFPWIMVIATVAVTLVVQGRLQTALESLP